jgi:hypothetical protein
MTVSSGTSLNLATWNAIGMNRVYLNSGLGFIPFKGTESTKVGKDFFAPPFPKADNTFQKRRVSRRSVPLLSCSSRRRSWGVGPAKPALTPRPEGESFAPAPRRPGPAYEALWSLAVPANSWGENLPLDGRGRPSSPKRFSPTKGEEAS